MAFVMRNPWSGRGWLYEEMEQGPSEDICCWWSGATSVEQNKDGTFFLLIWYYPDASKNPHLRQLRCFGGGGDRNTPDKQTPRETLFAEAQEELFDQEGDGRITNYYPACRVLAPCERHKGYHAKYFSAVQFTGSLRGRDMYEGLQVTGVVDLRTGRPWVSDEKLEPPYWFTPAEVDQDFFPKHRIPLEDSKEMRNLDPVQRAGRHPELHFLEIRYDIDPSGK